VDKMTLAALEATLRLAMDPERAAQRIPLWTMITSPLRDLTARAESLAAAFRAELGLNAAVLTSESFIGGGSVPIRPISTAVVAVSPPFPTPFDPESEADWATALRRGHPPVIARVQKGLVLFDLRTITKEQEPLLVDSIRRVWQDRRSSAPIDPRTWVDSVVSDSKTAKISESNGSEGSQAK
jgi:L-seryl-tRNA(Ser) seleniumtransferase